MLAATAVASAGLTALATAPAEAAEIEVSDAQLRWGVSNEANNSAFAPGTFNFFSAGKIGDPAAGGQQITNPSAGASWSNGAAAGWSATSGNVTIEKEQADGSYAPATWAGTRTSPTGGSLGTPTTQTFSDHQVVIDSGAGTVDPVTNTAEIAWDGDFTVVFYSGMSFFYVSDPVLTVDADGTGEITATGSGFASSQQDMEVWEPVAPTEITLATLTGVEVTDDGFITTPDYLGVEYDAGEGTPQVAESPANEAHWGSFPQSFVDFAALTGAGPYWYSSGGSVDPNKPALPIEVSYSESAAPPAVTVTGAVGNPDGTTTVTVNGTGFDPALATGSRPPLAGQPSGTYVAFGKFAESWKPSAGAPSANRVALTSQTKWAVPAASMTTIGGPAAGAVELTPEGSFTTQLTLDKPALDTLVESKANAAALVNYGIYTYPGSGAAQPLYETFTPITFPATEFDDVAGTTFAVEIGWLAGQAITTGYQNDDGTSSFLGSGSVLREQMAAFLYRYDSNGANPPTDAPLATFTDVPASHVFSKHIKWLADEKITTGYAGNAFRPGQPVLREQMAAFLYRLAGEPEFTAPATSPFADVPTSHTFYREITWLASTKVTTGYTEAGVTTFKGSQPVLREQMAAFLFRFDNLDT